MTTWVVTATWEIEAETGPDALERIDFVGWEMRRERTRQARRGAA